MSDQIRSDASPRTSENEKSSKPWQAPKETSPKPATDHKFADKKDVDAERHPEEQVFEADKNLNKNKTAMPESPDQTKN